jgi:hypothetical protein
MTDFDVLRSAIFELDDKIDECWTPEGLPNPELISQVIGRDVTADEISRVGRRRKKQKPEKVPVVAAPSVDPLVEADAAVTEARLVVKAATQDHAAAKSALAVALDAWTRANGKRDTQSVAREFISTQVAERAAARTAPPPTPRKFASHLDAVAASRRTAGFDRGVGQSFRRGGAMR